MKGVLNGYHRTIYFTGFERRKDLVETLERRRLCLRPQKSPDGLLAERSQFSLESRFHDLSFLGLPCAALGFPCPAAGGSHRRVSAADRPIRPNTRSTLFS